MTDSNDSNPDSGLAIPKSLELPDELSAALERFVSPGDLCGPDVQLDEILDKVERECDDLEDRLLFGMRELARLCFERGDGIYMGAIKNYCALVRISYAASHVMARKSGDEIFRISALRFQAIGLRKVGELCGDFSKSRRLLERSVDISEEAVRSFPKDGPSEEWAMSQKNLAEALFLLALNMESVAEERDLSERAVDACEEALRHRTDMDDPRERFELQHILARALLKLFESAGHADARDMLARAAAAQEDALKFLDRKAYAEEWSQTQELLGGIRSFQAHMASPEKARNYYTASGNAFKAALRATSREDDPALWARLQGDLAMALCGRAARSGKEFAQGHYGRAIEAFDRSLEVFSRWDFPKEFAQMSRNLGEALLERAACSGGNKARRQIERAVEIFEPAVQDVEREVEPELWGALRYGLSRALRELAQHCSHEKANRLYRRCFDLGEDAIDTMDENKGPEERAYVRNYLGTVAAEMGRRAGDEMEARSLFGKAIQIYEEGLRLCEGALSMRRPIFEEKLRAMREHLRLMDEKPEGGAYRKDGDRKPQ